MFPTLMILALLVLIVLVVHFQRQNRSRAAKIAELQQQLVQHQAQTERTAEAVQDALLADLHDDLGASLLNLVYAAPTPEFADRARAILQDLRDIVTRARATPGTLDETLAQIEAEARDRLSLAGLDLDWDQELHIDIVQNPSPVSKPLLFHLFRLFREAISNTLKHANATSMAVRLQADASTLRIEIRDNGSTATGRAPGQGKDNMRTRADHLQGSVTWRAATHGGTKVLLAIPLHGDLPR